MTQDTGGVMVAHVRSLKEAMTILEEIVGRIRKHRVPPDWARYALIYDLSVGELLTYQALIEGVVLDSQLKPGMTIVDAATGTGNLIARATVSCPDLHVYGFENELNMLENARDKFNEFNNISLHLADLNASEWVQMVGEGQADVVFSVNTLYILKDPGHFFQNVRRALRPGGRFLLSNPVTEKVEPVFLRHVQQGGEITDEMIEMVEINYDIITFLANQTYYRPPVEELVDLGANHGLVAVDSRPDYADVNATVEFVAV